MGALFAALSAQLIGIRRADLARTSSERQAVPYLGAVSLLTVDLAQARSAAVRGQADPPGDLRASIAAMSDMDSQWGAALLTGQHWIDLRTAIDLVLGQRPTGVDASDRYTDLVAMGSDLLGAASAGSQLDADPDPASRSLALAVPELLTLVDATGRAADIAALAAGAALAEGVDPDAATTDDVDVAVALHDAGSAYGRLVNALTASVAAGSGPSFTATVAERLTLIHDALGPIVGPDALRPAAAADLSAATLDDVARQVRELVRSTTQMVLDELGRQLATREEAVRSQMVLGVGTAAAGLLLGIVVLWWSAAPPAPSSERGDDIAEGPDVASVSVHLPAVDARELLALEELVHVGRGVRGRPSGGADDAQ
jgi:hypothetical protein